MTRLSMKERKQISAKCSNCNKDFKNIFSASSHKAHCLGLNSTKQFDRNRGWAKGLTKETDPRIAKNYEVIRRGIEDGRIKFRWGPLPEEARRRLSVNQSINHKGGRCKWYVVNGQSVQGTWERNLAEGLTRHEVLWYKPKVNKDVWSFVLNGRQRSYTPDFYLPDFDVYFEVKGFWRGNDKEKTFEAAKQNQDKDLIIVDSSKYRELIELLA